MAILPACGVQIPAPIGGFCQVRGRAGSACPVAALWSARGGVTSCIA